MLFRSSRLSPRDRLERPYTRKQLERATGAATGEMPSRAGLIGFLARFDGPQRLDLDENMQNARLAWAQFEAFAPRLLQQVCKPLQDKLSPFVESTLNLFRVRPSDPKQQQQQLALSNDHLALLWLVDSANDEAREWLATIEICAKLLQPPAGYLESVFREITARPQLVQVEPKQQAAMDKALDEFLEMEQVFEANQRKLFRKQYG